MARPRKEPDERRSETLAIRLTPAERIRIEHAAQAAGLNASAYPRGQVFKGRVIVRQYRSLDHAAFEELRRIGVNLNQLTRLAHQRQRLPAALAEVTAHLERILIRELDDRPSETKGRQDPAAANDDGVRPAARPQSATDDRSADDGSARCR